LPSSIPFFILNAFPWAVASPEPTMLRRLKVLVADDERDTREYFQELLSRQGHEVVTAADGLQLVGACRAFAPDLVLTDFAMPGMDGLAAAAEVNRERTVPVILVSGQPDVEQRACGSGHVVRVLAKPVKEAELRAAVEALAGPCSCAGK